MPSSVQEHARESQKVDKYFQYLTWIKVGKFIQSDRLSFQ
jgi:hypothetical protein